MRALESEGEGEILTIQYQNQVPQPKRRPQRPPSASPAAAEEGRLHGAPGQADPPLLGIRGGEEVSYVRRQNYIYGAKGVVVFWVNSTIGGRRSYRAVNRIRKRRLSLVVLDTLNSVLA